MVQVVYRDGIRQAPPLGFLVEQVNRRLEEVLGTSAHLVSAEWDRGEDSFGHEVLILRLSDSTGSATATFDPKELEQPVQLRDRFRRLWGDLLQLRSRKQLDAVLGVGDAQGE